MRNLDLYRKTKVSPYNHAVGNQPATVLTNSESNIFRYSMDMEILSTRNVTVQTMICSLVLQTAQKSLLSLLFMVHSS